MPATKQDLYIEQGATFVFGFVWRNEDPMSPGVAGAPVDLTGATARMQIRKNQQSPILAEITSTGETPGITLGGASGQVTAKLTAEQTNELTSKSVLYDMEIVMQNGDIHRAVEGRIEVQPNITQLPAEPVVTP